MAASSASVAKLVWDQKPNLVLIGMPSAGKSTVGKLLAAQYGLAFIDTDWLIEQRENSTLQQVVNRRGLKRFREIEAQVVSDINIEGSVISTGGSVIYSADAMNHLASIAGIAYLKLSLATVLRRLHNVDSRGLAKMPGHTIQHLFYRRTPMYRHWANRTVENDWPLTAMRRSQLLNMLSPDQERS